MPDPPLSRHDRVKQVFLDALDLPRGRRAAFLARECGDDPAVHREVLELFLLHGDEDSLLDSPVEARVDLADPVLPTCAQIGPWRKLCVLGRGGAAVVFLVEHADDHNFRAALKVMTVGAASLEARERFRLEAEILRRLNHPGIAHVIDTGEHAGPGSIGHPWIAMEYVDGRPLHEFAGAYALGLRDRAELLAIVCDAVQHAHSQGIVHRDLKPANILVRSNGQPVVLDFGVARLMRGDERPAELMTRIGQLVGTPQYMSPEQVEAEPQGIGQASDVYSLGMIGYELICGQLPYDASSSSLHRAIVTILTAEPPALGDLAPEARGALERIIGTAIQKAPHARYPDAGNLADDLRRFLAGRPVVAHPAHRAPPVGRWSRRRLEVIAAIGSALVVGLAVGVWVLSGGPAKTHAHVVEVYRQAEMEAADASALLGEGEYNARHLQEAIELDRQARALLGQVPPLRDHDPLLRHIESDLGTAQLFFGEITEDAASCRAAALTLEHAQSLPTDTLPHWRHDLQVTDPGALTTSRSDLLRLLVRSKLGLHRLLGRSTPLDEASRLAHDWLAESRLSRTPLPRAQAGERDRDPLVDCFNSLAALYAERARFSGNPALARAALAYSDSALARRPLLRRSWPVLDSVLDERFCAFRALGEITGSREDLDSALVYLDAASDLEGSLRDALFVRTQTERSELHLAAGRLTRDPKAREALFTRSRGELEQAFSASLRLPRTPATSLASLEGEVLTELGRATRNIHLLDAAGLKLWRSARDLPAMHVPREAALNWVRQAQLARARHELAGTPGQLEAAKRALDHASSLAEAAGDSLVMRRIERERELLQVGVRPGVGPGSSSTAAQARQVLR